MKTLIIKNKWVRSGLRRFDFVGPHSVFIATVFSDRVDGDWFARVGQYWIDGTFPTGRAAKLAVERELQKGAK